MEVWKDIPGYEGLYQASTLGRIKSLPKMVVLFNGGIYNTPERIVKPRPTRCGYYVVALFSGKNENRVDKQVHRLVATAFLSNPENKEQVNHIDSNKGNNALINLEWVTRSENLLHSYAAGTHKRIVGRTGMDGTYVKRVQCMATGRIMCVKQSAEWTGVSPTYMVEMLKERRPNWTTFTYF